MSFGIYKQGQGYWVRVMSAAFVGVLVIAAAAWGWGQAGTIRLPAREWTFTVNNIDGSVAQGDQVELLRYSTLDGEQDTLVVYGDAIVSQFVQGRGPTATMAIDTFSNNDVRDQGNDVISLRVGDEDAPSFTALVRSPRAIPIYPVQYLQSAIAGGIMLLGAILTYVFVGAKRGTVEFLIATDGEMKKVNWTTYREVKGSTIVVIVATFLIAGFLFGVDSVFAWFFKLVGVLE